MNVYIACPGADQKLAGKQNIKRKKTKMCSREVHIIIITDVEKSSSIVTVRNQRERDWALL